MPVDGVLLVSARSPSDSNSIHAAVSSTFHVAQVPIFVSRLLGHLPRVKTLCNIQPFLILSSTSFHIVHITCCLLVSSLNISIDTSIPISNVTRATNLRRTGIFSWLVTEQRDHVSCKTGDKAANFSGGRNLQERAREGGKIDPMLVARYGGS